MQRQIPVSFMENSVLSMVHKSALFMENGVNFENKGTLKKMIENHGMQDKHCLLKFWSLSRKVR
jgi:hypothetical protein